MTRRAAVLALLLLSSRAFADDALVIAPTCVTVDPADVLPPADREIAQRAVVRAFERHDVLVVEHDCTDHYVLAHQRDVIQLSSARRVSREPDLGDRTATYALLVDEVLSPDAPRAANVPTATYGTDDPAVEVESEALEEAPAPHSILYGQVLVGSMSGFAGGYRHPIEPWIAIDVRFATVAGDSTMRSLGAALLGMLSPRSSSSGYLGGGLSIASEHDGHSDEAGPRFDAIAGLEWGRHERWSKFVQGEVSYSLYGTPNTVLVSFGLGL
jgi:hypothetical protein